MREITKKVYSFSELSKSAQEKAIVNIRESSWYLGDDWYNSFSDELNNFFEVKEIYFSGFYGQCDGAMFDYSNVEKELIEFIIESFDIPTYKKNILKNVTYHCCSGDHIGRYFHEKSASHAFLITHKYESYKNISDFIDNYSSKIEDSIIKFYNEKCRELFKELKNEYDFLNSDEEIIEFISGNEYEFYDNGERYLE